MHTWRCICYRLNFAFSAVATASFCRKSIELNVSVAGGRDVRILEIVVAVAQVLMDTVLTDQLQSLCRNIGGGQCEVIFEPARCR